MRYPRAIYDEPWAKPFGWVFPFIVPVRVVVSVPAETMVKAFHPQFIAWTICAAAVLFAVSRGFFRLALRAYRSASR